MPTSSGSHEETIKKMLKGDLSLKKLDELLGKENAVTVRRTFLEKRFSVKLDELGDCSLDPEQCQTNIENMIGAVQLPIGIAGPLKLNGDFSRGEFYLPLATSEGALVASVSRGCKAIALSGGADAVIILDDQSRSLLFKTGSIKEAKEFGLWIHKTAHTLRGIGEQDSSHLTINSIEPTIVGTNVWLLIRANTKDAMGMNMITLAGKRIADHISRVYPKAEFISESGNLCSDKKPAAINTIKGRGKWVIASVKLQEKVIKDVLKTTGKKLVEMNYRKNLLGSAVAGSLGFNAHFANVVAAMFLATGQDAAHVVDGSLGYTTMEETDGGVVASITMTALQVGTVGGGTSLPVQKQCLDLLQCQGPSIPPGVNSKKLAEIIAGAVLAGEISLLAALCTKQLSSAHERLNR